MTTSADIYLTAKQVQLISTLAAGNSDGSEVDLDQLLERLPYRTSKESLQFSVRALAKRGLVAKKGQELRRGRLRRLLALTAAGESFIGAGSRAAATIPAASFCVPETEDSLSRELEALKIG